MMYDDDDDMMYDEACHYGIAARLYYIRKTANLLFLLFPAFPSRISEKSREITGSSSRIHADQVRKA